MEDFKYAPKILINEIIDDNYNSIFESRPDVEYIASVPKSIENPNDSEYFIEIGLVDSSSDYIPVICNDGSCILKNKNLKIDKKHHTQHKYVNHFSFQFHNIKERPLKYGVNIANQYLGYGTLGAIVEVSFGKRKSKSKFILSNHHVLCGAKFVPDRFISQPHRGFSIDGYQPRDIIAQVKYGHIGDEVDVAFAKLFDIDHSHEMYISGEKPPVGIEQDKKIKVGDKIYKIGATTGKTTGVIRSKNAYVKTRPYKTSAKKVIFKKQLLFDDISKNGDSGSLVLKSVNNDIKAIGLLMGGDNKNYSIANQMRFIFNNKNPYKNLPDMNFVKFI
ncbi:hypothetical protein [Hyunsoonleella ulvae]|uniref:hypothetical protein n=1 Tax=Hyunsoonleella ulvae TaxID=2799948 RepID=UPI001939A135|nr:hypothetical protein [Hyunsoonleella ulvae]